MLSVLIPVYNYNVRDLISRLSPMLIQADIKYEIIILDDGSDSSFLTEHMTIISEFEDVKILHNDDNHGRISSRRRLATEAQFNWLLYLDADVIPKNDAFIAEYLKYLNGSSRIIYGGYYYSVKQPSSNKILRWKYGRHYEQVSAQKRNIKPYKIMISGNFLIQRSAFDQINNEISSDGYGYDNIFAAIAKKKATKVLHIDNEVIHQGLDNSDLYLEKVKSAVKTSLKLYKDNDQSYFSNSLLKWFHYLNKMKLTRLMDILFNPFKSQMESNLLGPNPSMFMLQSYKLGYLCHISRNF